MADIGVSRVGHVVVVELRDGPLNFASIANMTQVGDALQAAEADGARAGVICSEGKSFCAGAQFAGSDGTRANNFSAFVQADEHSALGPFYTAASRIFDASIPLVAAVHGPAVGAGFGLALACDLRVICPEAFMATNFVRLGIHPGFGISLLLPELLGPARASDILLTGRRISGQECFDLGLANRLVAQADVRSTAIALASEISEAAPLAVQATRQTLRGDIAARVRARLVHERNTQDRLSTTSDAEEGIAAMLGKRDPVFNGK